MNFLKDVVDLFFPPRCLSCSKKMNKSESFICDECRNELKFIERSVCDKCGTPLHSEICDMCEDGEFVFDQARSVFNYENSVRNLIHNFKYNEVTKISRLFAEYLYDFVQKNDYINQDYLFLPVPLHTIKKKMRGFNQAKFIADDLAKLTKNKVEANIIKRNRFTKTQTKLGKEDRKKNLHSAFKINDKFSFRDKNFLIIDDVFTTGSTVNELSKILREKDANKIKILTVARAKHDS